ncbi:GrpB family protein [Actinomadura sp. NPDC000600]|uniref:GrpB family protein n=1 Tax=Actinomadura sp. NPDC000600 TaxID=3154262 RepID=UPI0033976E9D
MLKVAVTGPDDIAVRHVFERLEELAADESAAVRVTRPSATEAASCHLVIGVDGADDPKVDAWVPGAGGREEIDDLWRRRIAPFALNLARRRRAPRLQKAVVVDPDPSWPAQADRLMRRLAAVLGDRARRIDHIGSTSVAGLPAKNIIDLQVVVDDLDVAVACAAASHDAGFVHVVGPFYGIDRHGAHHDEQVAVDADPCRPANVHFHPAASPLWREMLLLRDWLRADEGHREEYASLKRALAGRTDHDVDDYGRDKMPWIGRALKRAEGWACR